MFDPLRRIADNVIALRPNAVVLYFIRQKEFKDFIIRLNQSQLFDERVNSLGVTLDQVGGGYSPVTESMNLGVTFSFGGKSNKKVTGDAPFLYDTGEFYESFRVEVPSGDFATFFEIEADGQKDDSNLFDDWGEEILGLTKESLQLLIDKLNEVLVPEIEKRIKA